MNEGPTVGVVCVACNGVTRVSVTSPPSVVVCHSCGARRPFALPAFSRLEAAPLRRPLSEFSVA